MGPCDKLRPYGPAIAPIILEQMSVYDSEFISRKAYGSGPQTRNIILFVERSSSSGVSENIRFHQDMAFSPFMHLLNDFSLILPTLRLGVDATAFVPLSSSTKTWNLNLSGCSCAKAVKGSTNSEGGSSPGVREQCIKVNFVFELGGSFLIFVLNNCIKGVIPVPPEIYKRSGYQNRGTGLDYSPSPLRPMCLPSIAMLSEGHVVQPFRLVFWSVSTDQPRHEGIS